MRLAFVFPPGKSGGLIEAPRTWRRFRSASCRFRRVNPAASLKHMDRAALGTPRLLGFRRVNPAASLKRYTLEVSSGAAMPGFRRVNPAASLKQVVVAHVTAHLPHLFPPGKSGGLIEAY